MFLSLTIKHLDIIIHSLSSVVWRANVTMAIPRIVFVNQSFFEVIAI